MCLYVRLCVCVSVYVCSAIIIRQLAVDIKSQSVRVVLKDGGATLLELSLYGRVQPDDCTWTLDGDRLQVRLNTTKEVEP